MKMQDPTVVFAAPVEMAEALQRECKQISLTSVFDGPRVLSLRNEVLILAFLQNPNAACYIQPEAVIGKVIPPSFF